MTSGTRVNTPNPRAANPRLGAPSACHGQSLCGVVWPSSSDWLQRSMTMTMLTKQCQQSNIDNDGNNGDGGDSNGNGNSNDAAAANNGYNVDEDGGDSRMAIKQ
jgi:hypothetical protein